MFFAAQESRHHLAGVLGTMLEIYDLDGGLEIQAAPVLQTKGQAVTALGLLRWASWRR